MAEKRTWKRQRPKGAFSKQLYGLEVPVPEPRMDWERLRRAKQRCEGCLFFNEIYGSCGFYKLPSMSCGYYMTERQKVKSW